MPPDSRNTTTSNKGKLWKICLQQIYRFLENTSVHGVKYLAEYRRPSIERILWFVSVILSMIVCGYLIHKSWETRSSSPVILAMDKQQRPVWDIPFPALTICPTDKIRPLPGLKGQKEDDVKCAMSLVCEQNVARDCKNASKIINTLTENAPQPDEIFVSNDVFKTPIFLGNSEQAQKPVLSKGGLCYSFNMLPGSSIFRNKTFHASRKYLQYNETVNWNIEKGYTSDNYPESYPRRAVGVGEEAGLLVLLKKEFGYNTTHNWKCTFVPGFEIQLHNPADFPSGERKFYASLNSLVQVFVTPEEVITDDLSSYTPDQRQCYYPGEHNLEFFEVYTQKNCELECLSKITNDCCKCVAFHMPRNENTSVCLTLEESKCLLESREWMNMRATGLSGSTLRCSNTKVTCKCLPTCMQLRYRYQVVHTKMDGKQLEKIYSSYFGITDVEDSDFTILQIFYQESHFIPFRRMEIYGTVEFLANCGGVLGLCLGISVLSLVELLYWLLVRPCCRPRARSSLAEPQEAEATRLAPL